MSDAWDIKDSLAAVSDIQRRVAAGLPAVTPVEEPRVERPTADYYREERDHWKRLAEACMRVAGQRGERALILRTLAGILADDCGAL